MAKISNTLSYPGQSPIEGADYLIGTAANSSPIGLQTKTFTIQGIADFVIDTAFHGVSYRLPIFTASSAGQESVLLVNSLFYQDTAALAGDKVTSVLGTTVYLDDGSGVGSLEIAENLTIGKITVANGLVNVNGGIYFNSEVYDANNNAGTGEQVLVSQTDGTVEWQNYQGSGLEFQGSWDARTAAEGGALGDGGIPDLLQVPLIASNTGKYWIVTADGSAALTTEGGGTITDWKIGDWAIVSEDLNNNIFWDKIDNSSVLTGAGTAGNIAIWTSSNELGDAPIVVDPIPGGTSLAFNKTVTHTITGTAGSNAFGSDQLITADLAISGGEDNENSGQSSIVIGANITNAAEEAAVFGGGHTVSVTATASLVGGSSNLVDGEQSIVGGITHTVTGDNTAVFGDTNDVSGANSLASGATNIASGVSSLVSGETSTASGQYSAAIGKSATASGKASMALGASALASGDASFASGEDTIASGDFSTAMGKTSTASGITSTAIGFGNSATGGNSVAIGSSTTASAGQSFACGSSTTASGDKSFASGQSTIASGTSSTAMGKDTEASGLQSMATGENTEASGNWSFATGDSTIASGNFSLAGGDTSKAGGNYSVSLGLGSEASGDAAIAMGDNSTIASGATSVSMGQGTLASGIASVSMGGGTTASGDFSISLGKSNQASGDVSIAIGDANIASGFFAQAYGKDSEASGDNSFAFGTLSTTTASGEGSFTFGEDNESVGVASFTFGGGNIANGDNSYTLGKGNTTSSTADFSIALGDSNQVAGEKSIVIGTGLNGTDFRQIILGSHNVPVIGSVNTWSAIDNLLIVGNGEDAANQSNALEIKKNGFFKLPSYGSGTVIGIPERNIVVDSSGNLIESGLPENKFILTGMVNNLASQASGYDFMQWTSNVTPDTQIPLFRTPVNFRLTKVTWVWSGASALNIPSGSDVKFSIGTIPSNTNPVIANYTSISDIFVIDNTDNGTWASGDANVSASNITASSGDHIAIIGTETGAITPNDGELSISLMFTEI